MTTLPSNDYRQLAARFRAVRRGWKRAAALSGLAIVVTEATGLFTMLLILDWVAEPSAAIRVALWAVALVCLGALLVRHVWRPLARQIPDEQIALYIEERQAELDGVLITAVEYGSRRDGLPGSQSALIDHIVHEAAVRSGQTSIRHVVDLSRLWKYAFGALACLVLYTVLAVFFPHTFGHRLERTLQPWRATPEDTARQAAALEMAAPIRFTLSRGNTNLARGGAFGFEVTLSKQKPAASPVELFFRPPAGGSEWQHLSLQEIEKLNTFQGAIPDVSEDLEFYVACGPDRSGTFRLTVHDPLVVQSLEMQTHYPDYLKQPDQLEKPFAGDLTAVVGSTATLRILASTPLKEGRIQWSDGQSQAMVIDPRSSTTAGFSFEVKADATYAYTLTDVDGQFATCPAPLTVHAVPDKPPTVTVRAPQPPVLTSVIGEINFDVAADDDFGVEGLDLVYARIDAEGDEHDVRVPLPRELADGKNGSHGVAASYRLALEDIVPPLQPNDALPYHVEARDAKGQVTSSPIGLIIVVPTEHWATWASPEKMKGTHQDAGADLMALLALVWELDNQKAQLKTEALQQRSLEIAAEIEGPDGTLNDFLNLDEHPQVAKVADLINGHIRKGHDALAVADTNAALSQLSVAVAIYAGNGINLDARVHGNEADEVVVGSHSRLPSLTMLEQARLTALANAAKANPHDEKDAAMDAETARTVADLLQAQDALLAHAKELANAQNPGSENKGTQPNNELEKTKAFGATGGAGAGDGKKPPGPAELAAQQKAVAARTRTAASNARERAAAANQPEATRAADEIAATAKMMEEAAQDFAAGNADGGQLKAAQAQTHLQEVSDGLQNTDRDRLATALGEAERHATMLLEKQTDLGAETAALGQEVGTNPPDQRQQRDLQKLAYEQTILNANAESLNDAITALSQHADGAAPTTANQFLAEAQKVIKRGQPQTKMANATVDLHNGGIGEAESEQKAAEGSLQKLIAALHAGSDSLTGSRDAQLNRARQVAAETKKSVASVQAQEGAPGGSDPAAGGEQKGGGPATPGGHGNGAASGDDVRQLAYDLTQLSTVVGGGQLVPPSDVERLQEMSKDRAELEKRLAADPKYLQGVANLVGGISDKIEAEMAAKSEAGKLFSSQREECPPYYRPFVNKYFEALSQAVHPPAGKQP